MSLLLIVQYRASRFKASVLCRLSPTLMVGAHHCLIMKTNPWPLFSSFVLVKIDERNIKTSGGGEFYVVCTQVYRCAYDYAHVWRLEKDIGCLPLSLAACLPGDSIPHWTGSQKSVFSARLSSQQAPGIFLPLSPCWDYGHAWPGLALSQGDWGFNLISSHLPGRALSHWAISPSISRVLA